MDTNGPVKSDYRKFNIEGVTAGDDYGAMHQALLRRYTRLKKGEGKIPDILFIDGGKGQVSEAEHVLEELQIDGLTLIGVAKGSERKPGLETLIVSGRAQPVHLPEASPALHVIQQIRDEAHRFAISAHRNRRSKARKSSILEQIPGLGPKRRQLILKQFGGLQQVYRAGVEELTKLPGISDELAQRIYDTLHPED
jgi:excinuclease ABC subunit C